MAKAMTPWTPQQVRSAGHVLVESGLVDGKVPRLSRGAQGHCERPLARRGAVLLSPRPATWLVLCERE